jgi:hypothetical protein
MSAHVVIVCLVVLAVSILGIISHIVTTPEQKAQAAARRAQRFKFYVVNARHGRSATHIIRCKSPSTLVLASNLAFNILWPSSIRFGMGIKVVADAQPQQEAIGLAARAPACCCLPWRTLPAALALTGWGCSGD